MSKAYVGSRVQSVDIGEELEKITKVVIVVDSDHVYTAGDDSGRRIERVCPWGSQEMADALLQKLADVVYKPFSAERAMLSPAFEIGDAVTVGGVYSQIVGADINYGVSGLVDIFAPDLDTTDDEYPAEKTQQSSIERQLAKTRSSISKTAEKIRLEVFGEDGVTATSIVAQLGSITASVEGALGTDDDGDLISVSSSIGAALDGITLEVSSSEGTTTLALNSNGAELTSKSFDLHVNAVNIHGKLTADQIDTDELYVDAANITGSLTIGQLPDTVATTSDIPDVSEFLTETGVTTIIGGVVTTDYVNALGVTAVTLQGETIQIKTSDGLKAGQIDVAYTQTGYGLEFSTIFGGILLNPFGNFWVDAMYGSMGITQSGVVCGVPPVPVDSTVTLGSFSFPWADVYTAYGTFSELVGRVQALEEAANE